mgnify:CR=1 FL=1
MFKPYFSKIHIQKYEILEYFHKCGPNWKISNFRLEILILTKISEKNENTKDAYHFIAYVIVIIIVY